MPQTVAIMGRMSAFHGIAAHRHFGKGTNLLEQADFDAVIHSLEAGYAEYGLMAWDNSLAGPIPGNRCRLLNSNVYAVEELFMPIQLHLLGLKGARKKHLKVVRSHPMALKESSKFLAGLSAEGQDWPNTASAAESVADGGDPSIGAIASLTAAKQFHLDVLAKRVDDQKDNITRFLVLGTKRRKDKPHPIVLGGCPEGMDKSQRKQAFSRLEREGLKLFSSMKEQAPADKGRYWHFEFQASRDARWSTIRKAFREAFPKGRLYGSFPPGQEVVE
jgi:prephenate dehydratase